MEFHGNFHDQVLESTNSCSENEFKNGSDFFKLICVILFQNNAAVKIKNDRRRDFCER